MPAETPDERDIRLIRRAAQIMPAYSLPYAAARERAEAEERAARVVPARAAPVLLDALA